MLLSTHMLTELRLWHIHGVFLSCMTMGETCLGLVVNVVGDDGDGLRL